MNEMQEQTLRDERRERRAERADDDQRNTRDDYHADHATDQRNTRDEQDAKFVADYLAGRWFVTRMTDVGPQVDILDGPWLNRADAESFAATIPANAQPLVVQYHRR